MLNNCKPAILRIKLSNNTQTEGTHTHTHTMDTNDINKVSFQELLPCNINVYTKFTQFLHGLQ